MTVVSLEGARRRKDFEIVDASSAAGMPLLIADALNPWIQRITTMLDELLKLKPGWDGYQGQPVPFATAVFALDVVKGACRSGTPRPDIMPGSGGDILMEWEHGAKLVHVHVRAPNDFTIYRRDDESGLEDEMPLRNDVSRLASWLNWLSEDGGDVAAAAAG